MALRKLLPATAVFLLLLTSTAAFAQDRAGKFSVSPLFGGCLFEGDQNLKTSAAYGGAFGYNYNEQFGVELGFSFIDSGTRHGNSVDVNTYYYHMDGVYHTTPWGKLQPYVAVGVGGMTFDYKGNVNGKDPSTTAFAFNYGGGLEYFLMDNFAVRGDVRHVITTNGGFNDLLYTAGVTVFFGGHATAPVEAKPLPPVDTDGDGVIDENDRCPGTPKGVKVDSDGCPLDTDGDGVYDYMDKCPGTPKGVKVDANGCPLDTDGDGVPDYLDKCPDTPKGVTVDANGCPPPVKKAPCGNINIEFDTNKSFIKPMYHDELKRVADCLKDYPENKAVIEGHTDNRGSASLNEKLSQDRAESVRNYLIENFDIAPERLSAKGYGASMPIADNGTEEGLQKNRRIELNMTQ